ncbi:methionine ABC transporter ATP-binding protein [Chitinimonas sp.]|uniref:methionine ABC transporter ATP-binding protein n=1 Tax=Chitinimonas sp. TaxID=1934313 RepID=UPI0032C23316
MISLHHLYKTYPVNGQAYTALNDVSLDIAQGEIFGIIGRSGAGKSTLLRTLNLLERPDSGQVLIADQDVTALDAAGLRGLRQQIGMVFQHFNLLSHRTVAGNIRFPLELAGQLSPVEMDARVDELLELVGLSQQQAQYPSQLSGGQKQRVGIARALANHPKLLLCDEATSALDPQTTQSILALLRDINSRLGLTIVLITHEMAVVRAICDRVAVIDHGRIVEHGPVAEVFLHPSHEATRNMVAEDGHAAALDHAGRLYANIGQLLRLTFVDDATYEPVLSEVGRELDLPIRILQGSVGRIKDRPYGQLIVGIDGELPAVRAALEARGVRCEEVAA